MSNSTADWHPARTGPLSTLLHIAGGIATSLVLFFLVSWSVKQSIVPEKKPEPITNAPFALPPPPSPERRDSEIPQTEMRPQRPIVLEKESFAFEAADLDVDYTPTQSVNTLAKLEMDLSELEVTQSDLDEMLVYERSELTRSLVPLWRPFPPVSKKIKGKNSVRVSFTVNTDGRVEEVYILDSTNVNLNQDVINGVKQWVFEPPRRGKKKVRARVSIRIDFTSSTSPFTL